MTAGRVVGPSLAGNPRISRWLTIGRDGTVLVRSGKVELGQGVLTALAQIAADELGVRVERVRMRAASTGLSPDESYTAGSLSVQHSGAALREVCAEARSLLLHAAASRLGVSVESLKCADGEIVAADGRSTSYWELTADDLLERDVSGTARPALAAGNEAVGRSVPRVDGPDKIMGRPRYLHDLRFADQLYGRVLRPPSRLARLLAVDDCATRELAGVVEVVRDGSVLGVLAEREEVAVAALARLARHCEWQEQDSLPDETALADYLLAAPAVTTVLHESGGGGARPRATVTGRFSRPYLMHASIAPSCALARWEPGLDRLHVWSHSQGIYRLREELARSFGLAAGDVLVEHVEGAGCYGHNAADDVAYDAALLARVRPGRHVQVIWSREDELTWGPMGPAMVVDVAASCDEAGTIGHWQQEIWSNGHSGRPSSPGNPPLLAALYQAEPRPPVVAQDPPMARGGGSGRNALPLYDLPSVTVLSHVLQPMPLRTSSLRALGAHLNVFAIESTIDDLAAAVAADPIEYRLSLLSDPRAREVLTAAAENSGWGAAPSGPSAGRGVGFARYKNVGGYCAVVADVDAEAEVRVRRLTIAVDVGLVVNPDGVRNQVEGGALQSVSWTVKEQVRFDRRQVTSRTWQDYPILSFTEAPPVDVVLVDRPGLPSLGAGELSIGPTAAAIGNAVFDALGVRVRALPLTPANIIAALG